MSDSENEKSTSSSWLRRAVQAFRRPDASASAPASDLSPSDRFRVIYQRFREILTLNDESLELIADIEDAAAGHTAADWDAMARRVRRTSLGVLQMIRNLNEITNGRYASLTDAFRRIQRDIEAALPPEREPSGPLVVALSSIRASDRRLAGSKMANLGEAWWQIAGLDVPDGFVITTAAFAKFMTHNGLWDRVDRLERVLHVHGPTRLEQVCEEVVSHILTAEVPPAVHGEVLTAFEQLASHAGADPIVAMRSSAIGEDRDATHAGVYHTELHVTRERLFDAYRRVVASAYEPAAVAYRAENRLPSVEASMAVGCLRMVVPRCSGVMFSRDYADPNADRVVLSATPGVADGLALGVQDADEVVVEGGVPHMQPGCCVSKADVLRLVKAGRALEGAFGRPLDVEWAIDETGSVYVLQSRPMVFVSDVQSAPPVIADGSPPVASGGFAACPGAASGPVCIVTKESDYDQVPAGCVVVAHHSSPSLSRVMKRCAAIVTEVGSPTGHMAILARENRLPCIVGLADAAKRLRAGQVVTVDAFSCKVFDGAWPIPHRTDERLPATQEQRNELAAMRAVAEKICPLHLTNPASPAFRPESCQTMHDITRFIHEKVFGVMFHFGDLAQADRAHAVKLEASLPFDVLLYDVGGAVAESAGATGTIQPDNIESAPVRAFVSGLLDPRIRWNQPRPVSARGFLSVLGESMSGPPPEAHNLGRTSYVVASDRYMNFSTKAGYHFSTVDCYCGDSLNKNYVHFRFAGGAAAVVRRARRTQFLATVLEQLGFRCQLRGDILVARLEKYQKDTILERLTTLGRLTMVSRQLDMLMDSDSSPDQFAKSFLEDRMDRF